jgi:amino acid adenylation domain-containing protein
VAIEAYVHQDLPFEKLVELQSSRDLSYNPLFQAMFVLQNTASELTWKTLEVDSGTAKFDLLLSMMDSKSGLTGTLEYNTDLFNADTIARMLGHFQTLLESIAANPDWKISELPLLTPTECQTLLLEWNNTQVNYSTDVCIHQMFEQQVEKTPEAIALIFENQQLTYRELNSRANKIAHYLQQLGVQPEVLVGICIERSIEMVVGLLAIVKAGGAYLPLDPAYPKERLAFMLADAQVPLLLTQQHLAQELPLHQAQVVCLDADGQVIANESSENPVSGVKPENLAYVIYTSGSTGKPKGVMNTHLGLCNRLLWMQDTYQLTVADSVLQKTPFSFDVSIWEFFWPLFTGASLVLAKPAGHQDSAYLVQLIGKQQITTVHFVPSMLQAFLEESELERCQSLKHVICSGEALPFELQERFFQRLDADLQNLYGPTEAAIDVTFWHCQPGSERQLVPIGRPIANTQIYLLDRHLQPVPIGVPGELHIGGVGLARGYLNQPDLTNEKFIPNPFEAGKHLYKTGDLARYRPDGNIEFLGRIDHQVKIRGFRIELGEIEAVLGQHPQVRETVVAARESLLSDRCLVAYVVPDSDTAPLAHELRDYLKERLPEYMVPSAFVVLDALPLTPNGKVDRRALPVPDTFRPELAATYQAPQSDVEKTITQIWQAVLNLDKVGIHDNFFDLGGHSLLMLQVNNKLRTVLHRDVSVVALFQHPTIYSLAQYLSQQQQPAFEGTRDRAQKQIEAINRQKQLLSNQGRKIHG